ncbi:hypothetical protein [Marisediminicola senii]|uniref:hypothetical protein n=1 Tax=Marisediminicola senii TaxID=2711233 RepID=UPI0013EB3D0F|nr:hypothetical protein [Marisediminicola senii]
MSERNTVIRSLHDLGLAAWFGGTLMGAVGLNGATAKAKNPQERLELSSLGWAKWTPVQGAALVAHAIGGAGLIFANKGRVLAQPDTRTNTIVKLVLTGVAIGTTVYSGIQGVKIADRANEGGTGVTEPGAGASESLASAQKQQKVLQWLNPALTGILIVLAAQQGEQQRPIAGLLQSKINAIRNH